MAFVFDGGVCVFWVFCCWLVRGVDLADDSTTDKARKTLVNKLNQQHGKENVVVIKEIENKKFLKSQGNI
jgi:hypothetical protein